jgi:non-ribosomal peptide synthetase component F
MVRRRGSAHLGAGLRESMKNIGEARAQRSGDAALRPALLHDLFAHAAALWPDRIAIDLPPGRQRPERRQLSYAMLDQASNALAAQVQPLVQRECIVAIDLPRGPELYIAQLAVLKAGAALYLSRPCLSRRAQAGDSRRRGGCRFAFARCGWRYRIARPEARHPHGRTGLASEP